MDGLLARLRASRGFDAREVAAAKVARLARWFATERLDAAVVGVSGGVDSALALALLQAVARLPASPLRRVVGLVLPIGGRGATRQEEAAAQGRRVCEALGAEVWEAPLTGALAATVVALEGASGLRFDAWAEGQCLSVVRTPALYGAVALLRAHGHAAVVVGTTNRDEGAWLGFYGKASDGMVDVQPISDLHKSEVRALAALLGVPRDVVDAVPSGDVFDGRSDEAMIGAPYDTVEAVVRLLELGRDASLAGEKASSVARHHAVNAHKYRVGTSSVHLDVMPRGVPGGWPDVPFAGRDERPPPPGAIAGAWAPPPLALDAVAGLPEVERIALPEGFAARARGVLTARDCAVLREAMAASGAAEPVGVTGVRGSYGVGSVRATGWSPELAAALWERLRPAVPSVRFVGPRDPTDAFATEHRVGHRSWRVVGLSPLLRFMRYEPGGRHLGHYDAGYDYGDGRRTLLSVVFYLTDAPTSGATRFLRDGQEGTFLATRDLGDWTRDARDDEVLASVFPAVGDALVFDHRICHDVARWEGPGDRVSIRCDVVYEAVPDGRPCDALEDPP
ncbi:MAG: NAD(+) synthase [Polyangiales bacterium]